MKSRRFDRRTVLTRQILGDTPERECLKVRAAEREREFTSSGGQQQRKRGDDCPISNAVTHDQ
jgi:hypothetical protein